MADKVTKLLIIKTTAEGEQCNVEIDIDPERDYNEQTAKAFKLMDDRTVEMNHRIMGAREVQRTMTPETKQAVHTVIQHLQGQVPKATLDQLVQEGVDRRQREYDEAQKHKQEKLDEAARKREGKNEKRGQVIALPPPKETA